MLSNKDNSKELRRGGLETLKKTDKKVYELIRKESARVGGCREYHEGAFEALKEADGQIYELITREFERRRNTLQLIAAENQCSQAVLAALGSVVQNKTAEGFVSGRLHGGCEVIDRIESIAVERAKEVFGAQYANVQPHSGTAANQIVLTGLLEKGDKILSLGPEQGEHPSHGAAGSFAGKFFEVENYCVESDSFVFDYEKIRERAVEVWPKLIMCGASAYVRTIDFEKFREIADEVGAYLLADVSHIAGLIMAGAHPSPIDCAHFTTTSTYKAGGPRGGVILIGRDFEQKVKVGAEKKALWECIEKATFPGVQGTAYFNHIAAKAVFFKEAFSAEYRERQFKIVENAKRLARDLIDSGYEVLTGGTDNHMVLVNVADSREGLTGMIVQRCLEDCGIVVDMYKLPYESRAVSGIRLGTPIVTKRGMGAVEMDVIAALIDAVLRKVKIISESEYEIDEHFSERIRDKVKDLCGRERKEG